MNRTCGSGFSRDTISNSSIEIAAEAAPTEQGIYVLPAFGKRAIKGIPANATRAHIKKALFMPEVSLTAPTARMTLALIAKLIAI